MADYKAVIAGATGATGREFVCFLLARDRCKRVTVLARDAEKAAAKLQKTAAGAVIDQAALKQKLQIVEFDYEALLSEGSDGVQAKKLAGHSVGINCLGTTKGDAGGMKGWLRVDRDYYNAFTHGLKAQGVPALIQISWAGASARSWLAQPRTKGECDDVASEAGFASLVVLRPGLLDRGDQARPIEKFGMRVSLADLSNTACSNLCAFGP